MAKKPEECTLRITDDYSIEATPPIEGLFTEGSKTQFDDFQSAREETQRIFLNGQSLGIEMTFDKDSLRGNED
jgi:hypothetical protein